jgi:uncharacterized protein (TIGR03083 family)
LWRATVSATTSGQRGSCEEARVIPTAKQTVEGFLANLDDFANLIRSIEIDQWDQKTRCRDWTVAEIAAHVTGTVADVTRGVVKNQGDDPVVARQMDERRGVPAEAIARELEDARKVAQGLLSSFSDEAWAAPAPGGFPGTLRQSVHAMWFDAFLHADDIRSALGRSSDTGLGLQASLAFVADVLEARGGVALTLALDGTKELQIGGGGRRVTGNPFLFLQAAKGRIDPAQIGLDDSINVNWVSKGA